MRIAPKHDFAAKLSQASLLPKVVSYVNWQKNVREARLAGVQAPEMPPLGLISINLDLTTACNFRCGHCIDWDKLNTGIKHVEEELFESLDEMIHDGLKSVILIGGGEPTVHRKFEEVVRFLKARNVRVGVVTNGSRGDVLAQVAPAFDQGDWIRLSLDSGENETFTRMHRPRQRNLTLDTICEWVPNIRKANSAVQVGFSFIISWEGARREAGEDTICNIDEIVRAAQRAKNYGFTYISFKPFLTRFEDGEEVMDLSVVENLQEVRSRIAAAIEEAKMLETDDFKVLESTNLRVFMEGNWRDFTNQPRTCHMMAFRQVLSPLGVFHCPAKRGVENSRVADKGAFTRMQKGLTRLSVASLLETFNASHECREIACLYNSTNWWLERLIMGDVKLEALPDRGDYFL